MTCFALVKLNHLLFTIFFSTVLFIIIIYDTNEDIGRTAFVKHQMGFFILLDLFVILEFERWYFHFQGCFVCIVIGYCEGGDM